ncbi:YdeI/OmpD-associated family protein [Enterococcus devriesei]|uniref:YdeI/OmpD-associated family protein n=1 Tax=Enterococcus devriesei TaxID=319970 RepID=UPI001C1097C8|nr:YdeI/OmpD-associated family protein [Enterococcus devriesei]MBU5365648.1 YdeI/OmpD-associated family protein [Enterococcus devriesei]
MEEALIFETRAAFRKWLTKNAATSKGVWLTLSKTKRLKTLKASEALEEALCFGWIDGLMKKVDEDSYLKYFSLRRKNSKWSQKNKTLVAKLEKAGLMTELGREKIVEAKENGQWDKATRPSDITPDQIAQLAKLLEANQAAYKNFQEMSPSIQKTYTRAYFDAKTAAGKEKRLTWIMERTEQNLKPM